MSLFDRVFGQKPKPKRDEGYFKTFTAYQPVFTSWSGELYESEKVRSAIDARARHIMKLKVEPVGAAQPKLQSKLKKAPNEFQTWSQFLYRLSTILDMQNSAFLVPVENDIGDTTGVYCVLPSSCEIIEYDNEPWLRYRFSNGLTGIVEYRRCGLMTKFQYKDDFFGEKNTALRNTMKLIDLQNQGIETGIKNSASYRFMAQVNNFSRTDDLAAERKNFSETNFAKDAGGGLLLFPNTYTNIQQINQAPFTLDAEQIKIINTNIYDYYGVNEEIMQNKAIGDAWNAFYEGCIEPFSIQFAEVISQMLFTDRELAQGSAIVVSANRLQYMSNNDKLNVSAQMADRGLMTRNEIRQIWNLPPVEGGDDFVIRGEYYNVSEKLEGVNDGQEISAED